MCGVRRLFRFEEADLKMKKTIAVFARAPVAGKVKTRLAKHLGAEAACELYAAMLRDTLSLAKRAARNLEECEVVVAYTPQGAFEEGEGSLSAFWSGARMAQGEGDIGARMLDCIARLQQGGAAVVLIGSDAPGLYPSLISHAFEYLMPGHHLKDPGLQRYGSAGHKTQFVCGSNDLVFGPSSDGGFYLIGASRPVPAALFSDVEWSTPGTLAQVKMNAARLELELAFTPPWSDLDTIDDLRRFIQNPRLHRMKAPQTMRCLRAQKRL